MDILVTTVLKQKVHKALWSFSITPNFSVQYFWNTLTSSIERRFLADGSDTARSVRAEKKRNQVLY